MFSLFLFRSRKWQQLKNSQINNTNKISLIFLVSLFFIFCLFSSNFILLIKTNKNIHNNFFSFFIYFYSPTNSLSLFGFKIYSPLYIEHIILETICDVKWMGLVGALRVGGECKNFFLFLPLSLIKSFLRFIIFVNFIQSTLLLSRLLVDMFHIFLPFIPGPLAGLYLFPSPKKLSYPYLRTYLLRLILT